MISKSLDLTGQSIWKYPLASDTIDEGDINSLIDWLRTNPRLTMGDVTKKFEKMWSEYIGTEYSVYVNSGSSASLLMVYSLLNANKLKNKRFLVPANGWVTTLSPFIQFGIEPIMVDADKDNYNIDLNIVEDYLKRGDIDGFIFVHVLGVPHRKKDLLYLKEKYGCYILEDSCASVGAKYGDGSFVGTVGDMSSFSFYFGHQLSTIEGGFINTNDEFLYKELLKLRSHGWVKDIVNDEYRNDENFPFIFNEPGFNVRSTDLQAYIGLRQLKKADSIFQKRSENHLRYLDKLNYRFELQDCTDTTPVSLHIGILAESNEHRKSVIKECHNHSIETRVWSHGNLGKHNFWTSRYGEFDGEVSNKIYERGFIVPTHPLINLEDVDFISEVCNGAE
jgi:CDP-6-deoxy-D-xylo-4-hexulose-3-dehydrase